jgi:protein SCO1/2
MAPEPDELPAAQPPESASLADGDRESGGGSSSGAAPGRSGGPRLGVVALVALVAVVIGGGVVALAAGGKKGSSANVIVPAASPSKYSGSLASPAQPEPPLALRNYRGEPIDISQYKGKAVFLTFIYTHCPDVCPIIASNLGVALNLMGAERAGKVQVIAVSVDPRGDTPVAVARFLHRHGVFGRMQYLVGSQRELARVWKAWGVGSERDATNPELVNHSGLVYGISATGKVTTLYAANFHPQEIVHDAPLLASG